jgi:hypothetical protein
MTQVVLAPAGTHYADSIESPVPMDRLARFLEPGDIARLREIYTDRPVPTWGVTLGGRLRPRQRRARLQCLVRGKKRGDPRCAPAFRSGLSL